MPFSYLCIGELPAGTIVGSQERHITLEHSIEVLVLSKDKGAATTLIQKVIGKYAAQTNFEDDSDPIESYFNTKKINLRDPKQSDILILEDTQKRLGSIKLAGVLLVKRDQVLDKFWLEATELEKARILAGDFDAQKKRYFPLPEDWNFTAPELTAALTKMF